MANEEILIIKLEFEIDKPVKNIDELQSRVKLLTNTLKTIPEEGTEAFNDLAKSISKKLNINLDQAKNKIKEFGKTAKNEVQKGNEQLKEFRSSLKQIPAQAGSINAITQQVKSLEKSVKGLNTETQEFADKSKELKKLKTRLRELKTESGLLGKTLTQALKSGIGNADRFEKQLRGVSRTLKAAFGIRGLGQGLRQLAGIYDDVLEKNKDTDSQIAQLDLTTQNLKTSFSNLALRGVKVLFAPLNAVLGLVTKFFNFLSGAVPEIKKFSANSKELKGEIDQLNDSFAKEISQSQLLFSQLKKTNLSQEEKIKIVDKINDQYGEYLPNLLTEKSSLDQIEIAQRAVNRALTESFTLKIQQATLEDTVTTKIKDQIQTFNDLKGSIDKLEGFSVTDFQEFADALNGSADAAFDISATLNASSLDVDRFAKRIAKTNPRLAEFVKVLNEARREGTNIEVTTELEDGTLQKTSKELSSFLNLAVKDTKDFNAVINENVAAVNTASEKMAALTVRNKDLGSSTKTTTKEIQKQLTTLEQWSKEQGDLNTKIQDAIADGVEPLSKDLTSLINVTEKLNNANKEFSEIQEFIKEQLDGIVKGSLTDLNNQISKLEEQQANLNITSIEYIEVSNKIAALDKERAFATNILKTTTDEYAQSQSNLNIQLSDSDAQRQATKNALERIKLVTDASEVGAKEIEAIQKDLANQLKAIDNNRVQNTIRRINFEILSLDQQKKVELSKVENNEALKLAIEKDFSQRTNELALEKNKLQSDLLKQELEEYKTIQAEKTTIATDEEKRRQQAVNQVLEGTAQLSSKLFELVSTFQNREFEKQVEALDKAEQAAIAEANNFGANEQKKEQIRKTFAVKKEKLEKQQAIKSKALALGQAAIESSLLIIKALQTPQAPNAIAAAIAAALAAIQIGIIASTKFALGGTFDSSVQNSQKFAGGAYLKNGLYHSQGGMPIINPITGQKVAEIEKDEAIINKRSMRSRDRLQLNGTPYEIASQLNSYKGYGVSFPKKHRSYKTGGSFGVSKNNKSAIKYRVGGSYGLSQSVLKLQNGAIVASDIATEANKRFNNTSSTNRILAILVQEIAQLKEINKTGFESIPSTSEQLDEIAQRQLDEENAS